MHLALGLLRGTQGIERHEARQHRLVAGLAAQPAFEVLPAVGGQHFAVDFVVQRGEHADQRRVVDTKSRPRNPKT